MRTLNETTIALDDDVVVSLRGRLTGEVLVAGDPGYEEARAIWNGMIDRRPALIARCAGPADVVEAVRFAKDRNLVTSVKAGGHNIAGQAICEDGMVLDLSQMRDVFVDPVARTASVQAGCTLGDVDRETQMHGLAAVMGFVSTTGAAGVTVGGGFGYLTRTHGMTSDNLRSVEVVTADGELRTASDRENPDLFWAIRGGGGNFGVVTSFEYDLHPVGPEVVAGAIAWRGEDAAEVLEFFRGFAAEAPEELTCVAVLRPAPPAPWLREDVHGKAVVMALVCHSGSVEDGERAVASLKSFGSPVGDVIMRRPYVQQQQLLDATQPKGRRYYWKSEYLPGIDAAMLPPLIEHARAIASPHTAILLFQLEGALNRLPEDHSAAGGRDSAFVLNIAASWESAADDAANIEWARACWRDLRRFSTGYVYVNFLTEDEGADRTREAYGGNHARLAELKAKWDPDNFFRHNKNVAPALVATRRPGGGGFGVAVDA
ncbi:MAG: FAD-binding protein [Dehalococcoidia bacterium]|nr:FAD-binding protein [Dehalococcoidia bacterium]